MSASHAESPLAHPLTGDAGYVVEATPLGILWRPAQGAASALLIDTMAAPVAATSEDHLATARAAKMATLFVGGELGRHHPDSHSTTMARLGKEARQRFNIEPLLAFAHTPYAGALDAEALARKVFDGALIVGARPPYAEPKIPTLETLVAAPAATRAAASLERRYRLAGVPAQPSSTGCANGSPLSAEPVARVMLLNLLDWVKRGAAPPASRDGDNAARDADGNETAGLRLPPQALPIATFESARHDPAPDSCGSGGRRDFAATKADRDKAKDARPSLVERYGSRAYFVATMRVIADKLVKERLLLKEDADAYIANAKTAPF